MLIPYEAPRSFNKYLQPNQRTGSEWKRLAVVLNVMAITGLSLRQELMYWVSLRLRVEILSGTMKRLFARLPELDLFVSQQLPYIGHSKIRVFRLSTAGRHLCQELGWEPIESEWDKMRRLHQADEQPKHTASVLSFAYQVRRSSGFVTLLPECPGHIQPDVRIGFDAEAHHYVEVELGHGKYDKWRNMQKLQGFAAICTNSPQHRQTLVNECREVKVPVMATDLKTLSQMSDDENGYIWLERWG